MSIRELFQPRVFPSLFLRPFLFYFFQLARLLLLSTLFLLSFESGLSGFFFLLSASFFKSISCYCADHRGSSCAPEDRAITCCRRIWRILRFISRSDFGYTFFVRV